MTDNKLHRFHSDVSGIRVPAKFTFPFHYVPHELCKIAASEVMDYALAQEQWHDELLTGKMLGVLVVKDHDDALGYLSAYSGNLAHSGNNHYFVPHVYNLLEPEGIFRKGEAQITKLNHKIEQLEKSPERQQLKFLLDQAVSEQEIAEHDMRKAMEIAKTRRDKRRSEGDLSAQEEAEMVKESQFMKAELRRLKKSHSTKIEQLTNSLNELEAKINALKAKRKDMSEKLQQQLFKLFVVSNARGERNNVASIFYKSLRRLPPGGTGDCCAPKLLQYAFSHGYKPVCMAEFWVGRSPIGEVRHHGHFYPACHSKCQPLLQFMLQGLDVEDNPLSTTPGGKIEIIHEDNWIIVIDKPAGMLTVPGKEPGTASALELVKQTTMPPRNVLEVHRLDQATSGVVVFAKTKEAQSNLRLQFEQRTVSKTYIALLDGIPAKREGVISLPLRPDFDDRPRQVVDFVNGKQAITRYETMEQHHNRALVKFTPLTGRTHQLRVHASHRQGLNCPIVGDMLYGTAATRLHLHAQSISFTHPVTGEKLTFTSSHNVAQEWQKG